MRLLKPWDQPFVTVLACLEVSVEEYKVPGLKICKLVARQEGFPGFKTTGDSAFKHAGQIFFFFCDGTFACYFMTLNANSLPFHSNLWPVDVFRSSFQLRAIITAIKWVTFYWGGLMIWCSILKQAFQNAPEDLNTNLSLKLMENIYPNPPDGFEVLNSASYFSLEGNNVIHFVLFVLLKCFFINFFFSR